LGSTTLAQGCESAANAVGAIAKATAEIAKLRRNNVHIGKLLRKRVEAAAKARRDNGKRYFTV
jgi:hypothetical protein